MNIQRKKSAHHFMQSEREQTLVQICLLLSRKLGHILVLLKL